MTVENCLHFLKMAEMYGLSDCKRETKAFILDNFIPVARNDDFRSVSCDLFCEFLSDDRLRSQSELDVFKIALSWLETSVSPTRQAPETIRRVLGLVRYGLMSAEQMECIYSNPLLLGEACREVLQVSELCVLGTVTVTQTTLWVKKKQDTKLLPITSPKINRFSKFFHCFTQQEICNKVIFKYPTTP